MSVEIVRNYFKENNIDKEILEFPVSSATVELAAQAVGVEPARIAKTLSFYTKEKDAAILIVTAGDMKIDNSKFKHFFGMKAKMLAPEDVEKLTGHAIGGVCFRESGKCICISGCFSEKIRDCFSRCRERQFCRRDDLQ